MAKSFGAITAITLTLALASSASGADRRFTPDAIFTYSGQKFTVFANDEYDYLDVYEKSLGKDTSITEAFVKEAVESFVKPTGCQIVGTHKERGYQKFSSYHNYYKCPEGVDLRKIVISQRDSLKKQKPISFP